MCKSYLAERVKAVSNLNITSVWDLIRQRTRGIDDIIPLFIGEPDFDTPPLIKEAAKRALDEGYTHYSTFRGRPELRKAVADKLKSAYKMDFDPETEVLITAGSCEAMNLGVMATVNPGEEVLVPDPAWPFYEPVVRIAGGVPIHYPLLEENEFKPDIDDIKKRVSKNTKMIILNFPNNPTGAIMSKEDLEGIVEIVQENDLIVLSDEVYAEIVYDGVKHCSIGSFPEMKERSIIVSALSKEYAMTGWRLGYAASGKEITKSMTKLLSYSTTCVNTFVQKAGVVALEGSQEPVKRMVEEYKKRRNFVVKRLNEMENISCHKPGGTFYVFPNIRNLGLSSVDFALFLIDHALVTTTPGTGFGEYGEGYIRISYACSMESLEKALTRIENALKAM